MKRPVLPRIIGLLCLYIAVFVTFGAIQFARQGKFTRQVGDMQVSGHYKTGRENGRAAPGEVAVTGSLSVVFGGLEFHLAGEGNEGGLAAGFGPSGDAVFPEYMGISGHTAVFRFSGGGAISFTNIAGGDQAELQIRGDFPPDAEGFLLPYKPLRTSRVEDTENGLPLISVRGRVYSFSRSARERGGLLFLENGGAPVSYRVVPEEPAFSLGDYTLGDALSGNSYDALVRSWRDRNYSLWARSVQGGNDEDLALAFLGEALGRGSFQGGKSLVSSAFLNGNRRSYGSSLYLGGAARTYPALDAADRDRLNRLSRLIGEGSPEILGEDRAFEYLSLRGSGDLLDRALALVRDMDPAGLRLELVPGLFEGFVAIKQRSPREDPFGDLPRQACLLVSGQLRRVSGTWNSGQGLILVFRDEMADTEFNLRLGKALTLWAEAAGDEAWAAVGRSLVLSVLSLEDAGGTIPSRLSFAEIPAGEETERLDSARLYRILQPGEYYPRIAVPGIDGIWVWTCSPAVSADRENGVLDISVSFPAGETHYVMIWGLEPFNRMQLHSMDWRSDPRYESYDSSGWVYYSRDRLLVVKLKHRAPVEHIRLYYSQPAPSSANSVPAPVSPGNN
jgi:hypothetical protein